MATTPQRLGLPEHDDIAGQLRLYADQISNDEVDAPKAMLLIAFHDGGACGIKMLNIHPECARERIPILADSMRVLLQAIENDNAASST